MKTPRGFSFAGINAGIKAARRDMALVYSEAPCAAAGVFTVNAMRAAPVKDAASRLPSSGIHAIVVNSGNANALTGASGDDDVQAVIGAFARALAVPASAVLTASTGVIGVKLPVRKLVDAAGPLSGARGPNVESAAEAILTTDTRVKLLHRTLTVDGQKATIAAFAKGSGMVAPELATILAFITTDVAIAPDVLARVLSAATETSFNALNIDGEMSTNDAVFALANGLARNTPLTEQHADFPAFREALFAVCGELARAVAEDGEGATKSIEVRVTGAPDDAMARDLARAVAGSTMVKTAVFGADPNWGRVLASIGARVGSRHYPIDMARVALHMQGLLLYENGAPTGQDRTALRAKLREPRVLIEVDLGAGAGRGVAFGCDLSYDYVKINADYMALTSASEDGVVARDDRLTNYSPTFKRTVLVEALSYITRFSNKRAVIKYGGAAMVKDSLKASFANDINLLRSAGLLPIIVHGGGPEITKTFAKLGNKPSEYVDGVRVTDEEDLKVVEMVLTGKVNTEIVSLLNQQKAHAVGVSGKDAGLLRARKLQLEGGRDLGRVGEITQVNGELLDVLLSKHYVPVVSPIGLGEDGEGYNLNADAAAAEIAIALAAEKLIYVTDVPGLMEQGELISEIGVSALREKIASGVVRGGMVAKAKSILRALENGVEKVHIIDGRTPHAIIAELFTDKGVGTLIVRD